MLGQTARVTRQRGRAPGASSRAALGLVIALAGCQIAPTFTTGYELVPVSTYHGPAVASLAVARFTEERPPRYYNTQGRMFIEKTCAGKAQ